MRTILVTLAAIAFVSISTAATGIKSTVKLNLSRLGTDSPGVDIIDARVLALSNVFAGSFIGDRTDAPNKSLRRYRIAFDIQTRDGIKSVAYLVQYCVDDAAGQAFVYLPGRDDAAFGATFLPSCVRAMTGAGIALYRNGAKHSHHTSDRRRVFGRWSNGSSVLTSAFHSLSAESEFC